MFLSNIVLDPRWLLNAHLFQTPQINFMMCFIVKTPKAIFFISMLENVQRSRFRHCPEMPFYISSFSLPGHHMLY